MYILVGRQTQNQIFKTMSSTEQTIQLANPDTLDIFAEVLDTTFTDTNPLSGNAYYFLRSQDVHNNLSEAVEDSITEQTTFALSVSVNNGWNMVSAPGTNPAGMGVTDWWSGKDPAAGVFKYAGGYVEVFTTAPTEGYWMKNSGAQVYSYPAIEIVTTQFYPAAAGWNMIGGYETYSNQQLLRQQHHRDMITRTSL